MPPGKHGYLRLADDPSDYAELGIDTKHIVQREDGQRESTDKGHYEWWYFDCHLEDGTTVVVVFYTKPTTAPNDTLSPLVTINISRPDGQAINRNYKARPEEFSASKASCDVHIGDNRFVGDLHHYQITATIEDVSVDIDLVGEVPPWRPRSGHMYFGKEGTDGEKLFAWLPSVPQGKVTINYRIGDKTYQATGIGYHDHNWGDVPMPTLMHDWYWARAKIGPYTVIASYITSTEKYGYTPQTVYLLAKDGKIIADDDQKVTFETDRVATDEKTGKPVADITRYTYTDGDTRYVVTFERKSTILQARFVEKMPLLNRAAAKLVGFDGAYLRFTGNVTIEKFQGNKSVERFEDPAIWELMYFGKARPPAV